MSDIEPEHLDRTAARMLKRSTADRFAFIERDRVIETPNLVLIQDRLEELFAHHRILRPPNLALIAASGAGKSHAVEDFFERHKPRRTADGRLRVPVLLVEYPPVADKNWLVTAMLKALGYQSGLPRESSRLHELLRERISLAETRLIIVEEASRLYLWGAAYLREFYGVIVWLSNQTGVPIVLTGTEDLASVIEGDLQLVRRFERLELRPWALDQDFTDFVATYLRMMPLGQATRLDLSMLERLIEASDGITDTLVEILQRAVKAAILDGSERVLLQHVKTIDVFRPPPVVKGRKVQRGQARKRGLIKTAAR